MNFYNERGQVSRLLLVLAIVVLVAAVIVFLVIRMAERPPAPVPDQEPAVPQPVYSQTLGNVKFVFIDSRDLGNILTPAMAEKTTYSKEPLRTTERFIIVTIGAQNKGKQNIEDRSWDIGDIVDSEGRRFVPVKSYNVNTWIPEDSSCGVLLKPEFEPIPCTKIYEVSKISTGLKIIVITGKNNERISSKDDDNNQALLDLIIR